MSELTDKLREAGQAHKGTDLGALLQWAMLHIASQDEAIEQWEVDFQEEHEERIKFERALHEATQAVDGALQTLKQPVCPPIEFTRDIAPHINRSAAEGDKDYMRRNGLATVHTDLRGTEPAKTKGRK